jgi:GxxExxY protein
MFSTDKIKKPMTKNNPLVSEVINCAIEVHKTLGPGLLESAYEACLCRELEIRNIPFQRQAPLTFEYKGMQMDCAYRMDIVVAGSLLLELKSVDQFQPIHEAQIISYLKLSKLKQGLLINFNAGLLKEGLKSFLN